MSREEIVRKHTQRCLGANARSECEEARADLTRRAPRQATSKSAAASRSAAFNILIIIALFILLATSATAANDPGHDTLYVLKIGDSEVQGSINLTGNITAQLVRVSSRFFGDNLDIRADGSSTTAQNYIKGTATDLEIGSGSKIILNGGGTIVQIGTGSTPANLNVTGNITSGNKRVCLSDGTDCPGGNTGYTQWQLAVSDGAAATAITNNTLVNITAGSGISVTRAGSVVQINATGGGGNVTGSGIANYIARWTGSGNIGTGLIYDNGTNVGIGTAVPGATMEVIGSGPLPILNVTGVNSDTEGGQDGSGIYLTSTDGAYNIVDAGGDAGIISITGGMGGFVNGIANNGGLGGRINLITGPGGDSVNGIGGGGGTLTLQAGNGGNSDNNGGGNGGDITIIGGAAGNGSTNGTGGNVIINPGSSDAANMGKVIIASNAGNVGIGTASPTQKLHVIGNLNVSGTITQNSIGVCLSNGTNCPANGAVSSAGGWTNTSQNTSTTLKVIIGADPVSTGFTDYPFNKLTLYDNNASNSGSEMTIVSTFGNGYAWSGMDMGFVNTSNRYLPLYEMGSEIYNTTSAAADINARGWFIYDLQASRYNLYISPTTFEVINNSGIHAMYVNMTNGGVGIGTTKPNTLYKPISSNTWNLTGFKLFVNYTDRSDNATPGNTEYIANELSLLQVNPTNGQKSGGRYASMGYAYIPAGSTKNVNYLGATTGYAENYGTGTIGQLIGAEGWAWNNASATVGNVYGGLHQAESDAGTVTKVAGDAVWAGVYGGTAGGLYGVFSSANHDGTGTVTTGTGVEAEYYNDGPGNTTYGSGVGAYVANTGDGSMTESYGTWTEVDNSGNRSNIGTAYGLWSQVLNRGNGTITTGYGVYIESAGNTGASGTFTNNYGIYIKDQSAVGSTNSYNIYSAGASSKNYFAGTVNVTGQIYQNNVAVCLSNGTNCPGGGGNITGSGTNGYIPLWTGGSDVGSSIINQSGSTLTIAGNISFANSQFCIGSNCRVANTNGMALGTSANGNGTAATAVGYNTLATGLNSIAAGQSTNATGSSSIAVGSKALAATTGSIAIGNTATANVNTNAIAIGPTTVANGSGGIAIGNTAKALTNSDAIAIGTSAIASQSEAVAIGHSAVASGAQSIYIGAIGIGNGATGAQSTAIGNDAAANDTAAVALGYGAFGAGVNALSIGSGSTAYATQATAIGYAAYAYYENSTAIGTFTTANNTNSVAIGPNAVTTASNQLKIGSSGFPLNTNISGSLSAYSVYENGTRVCTATNGLCGTGSTGGWTNTSSLVSLVTTANNVSANTLFIDNTNGRVGVKTSTPLANFVINTSGNALTLQRASGAVGNVYLSFYNTTDNPMGYIGYTNAADNIMRIDNSLGNISLESSGAANIHIGIGTTTPNQKLEVNGNINATTYYGAGTGLTGTAASLTAGNSNQLNSQVSTYYLNTSGGYVTMTVVNGSNGNWSQDKGSYSTTAGVQALIAANGNWSADKAGILSSSGWKNTSTQVYLSNNATNVSVGYTSSTPNLFVDNTNGRVGINRVPTTNALEVNGSIHSDVNEGALIATVTGGIIGANQLDVQGRYAYVIASTNRTVAVFDISNPASPVEVSKLEDGTNLYPLYDIVVNGKYAYVTTYTADKITILDISNPSNISVYKTVSDATYSNDLLGLYLSGKYLFATGYTGDRIMAWDVSDPGNPVPVGISAIDSSTTNAPWDLVVQGKYAYVAWYANSTPGGGSGVSIYDVSDPTAMVRVGGYNDSNLRSTYRVDVSGSYVYLLGASSGYLGIVNVSDPTNPTLVSEISGVGSCYDIDVEGRYAYLSCYSTNAVTIVDISDPAAPFIAKSIASASMDPYGIVVQGRYIYIASLATNSFNIVDLGYDLPVLSVGSLSTGSLAAQDDIRAGNNLYVGGAASFGKNIAAQEGISTTYKSSAATAGTETNGDFTMNDSGAVGSGTDTTYGISSTVYRTGASAGTINTYAGYFSTTGDAGGTSTAYGIYATATGADTNWAGFFSGNVNVTGTIYQGAKAVCLSDGTNCPGGNTGYTQWRLGSDSGTTAAITNNTLVNITGGTAIDASISSSTVTIAVTNDAIDGAQLADTITLDANLAVNSYNVTFDSTTLHVDSTGNKVGIGTATPNQELQVNGDINATTYYGAGTGLTGTATGLAAGDLSCTDCIGNTEITDEYLYNNGDTASGNYTFDTSTLHIDSTNDRIGIGTTTPAAKIHVAQAAGSSVEAIRLQSNTNSAEGNSVRLAFSSQVALDNTQRVNAAIDAVTTNVAGSHHGELAFYTMGSTTLAERLRIDNTGNVGIGTNEPGYVLDVNGTTGIRSFTNSSTGYGAISAYSNLDAYGALFTLGSTRADTYAGQAAQNWSVLLSAGTQSNGLIVETYTADPLLIGTSNAERMRIDSVGRVGINTTAPTTLLQINGVSGPDSGNNPTGAFIISHTAVTSAVMSMGVDLNGGSPNSWIQSRQVGTTTKYALILNPNGGNVGIGTLTNSPNQALQVNGSVNATNVYATTSVGIGPTGGSTLTESSGDLVIDAGTGGDVIIKIG